MSSEPRRLILASRSPRRSAILTQLGIEFEVTHSDAAELIEGDPPAVVVGNALRKARAVAETPAAAGATVLGADTEVVLDGRVLGKPADADQARAYLTELSDREHEVHGGLALVDEGERTAHAVTTVMFRRLDDDEIDRYVATGEWRDKAGGYAIQGRGAALVSAIAGDYLNVVGLPVAALAGLAPELFD